MPKMKSVSPKDFLKKAVTCFLIAVLFAAYVPNIAYAQTAERPPRAETIKLKVLPTLIFKYSLLSPAVM